MHLFSAFILHQQLGTIATSQQIPTILGTGNGTGDQGEPELLICLLVYLTHGQLECAVLQLG
jgi:hypothetical protein